METYGVYKYIKLVFMLVFITAASAGQGNETLARILNENKCGQSALRRCARIADPILKDPKLAFPADENELKMVCRSFSDLLNCSKSFLENCIAGPSGMNYLQALEEARRSANDLCFSRQSPKKEVYLEHAVCLRSIVSDNLKCAKPFNKLVSAVMSFESDNSEVCCSHNSFRQCMLFHTKSQCDRANPGASSVAQGMIDSALNIIVSQCRSSNTECRIGKEENIGLYNTNKEKTTPWRIPGTTRPWLHELPKQQELHSGSPKDSKHIFFVISTIFTSLHLFSLLPLIFKNKRD